MVFTLTFLLGVNSIGNSVTTKTDYWESFQTQLQLREWNLFLRALIQVESGGNSMAIGKNNDGGILQITPIYVEEVNRLSKKTIHWMIGFLLKIIGNVCHSSKSL